MNFQAEFNISALEQVVKWMYGPGNNAAQVQAASTVLTQFKSHPNAWTRCHTILERASRPEAKFFALQILNDAIKTRWQVLPKGETAGMKQFVIETIIKLSTNPQPENKELLVKLDLSLVYILNEQGPEQLATFLPPFLQASTKSEALCHNNMQILKFISEEVFDKKDSMVRAKAQKLKDSMCKLFQQIFQLCQFVISKSQNVPLLVMTLQTLLNFLGWIPIGYVFKRHENGFDLIETMVTKFLNVPRFRNITIECLTEIAAISSRNPEELAMIKPKQIAMFTETMKVMQATIPLAKVNLATVYKDASEPERVFVQNLGLFLSTFLKTQGTLLETAALSPVLMCGLQYLVQVSRVDNVEIFKITLDYWHALAKSLFEDNGAAGGAAGYQPLMLGAAGAASPRRQFYKPALAELRLVMVMSMAKPEEVLVVETGEGEVIREQMKDTEGLEQYKQMREALVYLTHLDYENTETIMKQKLAKQVDGSEYYLNGTWEALNRLCWAIGSISGAMEQDREKKFLVVVIKDLLGMCENVSGKPAKAIIASNIMYIVGQYPRFLREHWKFLKTVVNKLFEFMHEKHEGVQDMACDTFIKIAKSCKKHFVTLNVMETRPFVEEILDTLHLHTVDLEKHQGHTFYQAIGHMIFAEENPTTRARLITRLMQATNHIWDAAMTAANANPAVLTDMDAIGKIIDIMKTNVSACSSIGNDFIFQLQKIYMHMLLVYKQMSQNIVSAIKHAGEGTAMQQPVIKQMRITKKEILRLIGTWIPMSQDKAVVMANIIPSLLEAVLGDFQSSIPQARDAEVLATMAKVVETMKVEITPAAPKIFTHIFEPTLQMITGDFVQFPEHRVAFYNLLKGLLEHCFSAFVAMSEAQWKRLVEAIIWGFRHDVRSVAETALKILQNILRSIASTPSAFSQQFFKAFYLEIMTSIFMVAVDSTHYSEMREHAEVLALMFKVVEAGVVKVRLNEAQPNNAEHVKQFVGGKLREWFPHLLPDQLIVTVRGFFAHNEDPKAFKDHLRDFLVETKQQIGQDVRHMYKAEREHALVQAEAHKLQSHQAIPGMIAPANGGAPLAHGGGGAAAAHGRR